MKMIYALSLALIFFQVQQGSAQTLACTFDEGEEGWFSEGSGRLTWQRFGGDPGAFFRRRVRMEAGATIHLHPGLATGADTSVGSYASMRG